MRKANTPALLPRAASRVTLPGLILSLLVYTGAAKAQCISTGNATGTVFTLDNTNSGLVFHSAANASHSDINYSSAQPLEALIGEEHTQYLKATGFNFSIPSNAVVCGVSVHIRKRAAGVSAATTISDEDVRIIKGGTLTGLNKRSAAVWSTDFVTETYSGDAQYWGTPLTPADVNDPRFGVALSAKLVSTVAAFPRAEIDQISIVVDYKTLSSDPQDVEAFTATLDDNIVNCEWTMAQEQAGSRIVLQQSTDNRQWKDLTVYTVTSDAYQTRYRQINRLEAKGTYFFRVKVTAKDASTSYSNTVRVQYTSSGELKVYPTIARSMIYVEGTDPSDRIQVYSFNNQLMPTTTVQVKEGLIAVRISELPKGRYILKAGNSARQFIKE